MIRAAGICSRVKPVRATQPDPPAARNSRAKIYRRARGRVNQKRARLMDRPKSADFKSAAGGKAPAPNRTLKQWMTTEATSGGRITIPVSALVCEASSTYVIKSSMKGDVKSKVLRPCTNIRVLLHTVFCVFINAEFTQTLPNTDARPSGSPTYLMTFGSRLPMAALDGYLSTGSASHSLLTIHHLAPSFNK